MTDDKNVLFPLNILVAEDASDIRMLFHRLLKRYGATVVEATDGADALNKNLASVDIVLMDLEMPVLDGYAAAPQMRAAGYQGPIVALTGHSVADAKSDRRKFNFDGYLQKPVSSENLVNMIRLHCPQKGD
ncbi:MAG: response regulator [Chitinophagaceae bacterium]|nr:response regulator [Oligoflexus sp.]